MSQKFRHYSKDPTISSWISQCMCLRLNEKETMDFLAKAGIKFHTRSLYNIKNKIKKNVSES